LDAYFELKQQRKNNPNPALEQPEQGEESESNQESEVEGINE